MQKSQGHERVLQVSTVKFYSMALVDILINISNTTRKTLDLYLIDSRSMVCRVLTDSYAMIEN